MYRFLLALVSRPALFPLWLWLRKLSAHALNMTGAARLPCDQSGEQIAFKFVMSKTKASPLDIFDVGANVGQYAQMCMRLCSEAGRKFNIYSFEPTSGAYKALEERLGNEQRVSLFFYGLSDSSGTQSMYLPSIGAAGATTHDATDLWVPGGYKGDVIVESCQFRTLDEVVDERKVEDIHLLKIDVEGAELKVLRGGQKTLESRRVKFIQFEISVSSLNHRVFLHDFWNQLSGLYKIYLVMNTGLRELRSYDLHLECFAGATNFLCELKDS